MIGPPLLALAALAFPIRLQAELGGYIPSSEDAWGGQSARFLDDFAPVEAGELETDTTLGLTFSAMPAEVFELGLSLRRYGGSQSVAVEDVPTIEQRQETTIWPLMAVAGFRGGPELVDFTAGLGAGAAWATVRRAGYLDDGESSDVIFAWRVYGGLALKLPLGPELGFQVARDELELPSTAPLLPIDDDRTGSVWALALTLGWSGDTSGR